MLLLNAVSTMASPELISFPADYNLVGVNMAIDGHKK